MNHFAKKTKADPTFTRISWLRCTVNNFVGKPTGRKVRKAFEEYIKMRGMVTIHAADNAFDSGMLTTKRLVSSLGDRTIEKNGPYVYYSKEENLPAIPPTVLVEATEHSTKHYWPSVRPEHPIVKGNAQWLHTACWSVRKDYEVRWKHDYSGNGVPGVNKEGRSLKNRSPRAGSNGNKLQKKADFHITLGHSGVSMECNGQTVWAGTEWAAIESVTQNFLPGTKRLVRLSGSDIYTLLASWLRSANGKQPGSASRIGPASIIGHRERSRKRSDFLAYKLTWKHTPQMCRRKLLHR
jgi:hypothetical protein